MATKNRIDLEVIFTEAHIPSLLRDKKQQHILTVELIYPRATVSAKTTSKTITLEHGQCDATAWCWTQKICFKETVEGNFGLHVTLSEKLSSTEKREAARYIMGKAFKGGADAVEDAVPVPVLDELAQAPLLYASKNLLAASSPRIIAEGYLDLRAEDFSGEEATGLAIPLSSCRKVLFRSKTILQPDEPDGHILFEARQIQ